MAGKGDKKGSGRPIIVRRSEIVEGGHHGGAWKVAYADFVTAMMAFFLLMWLLNATTEDQRKGLADYFSPNNLLSHASSGTGQPFGGHTAFDDGALVSDRGSVEIREGKRPPLDISEEGETQVFSRPHTSGVNNVTVPADTPPDPAATDPVLTGLAPKGGPVNRSAEDPGAGDQAGKDQITRDGAASDGLDRRAGRAREDNVARDGAARDGAARDGVVPETAMRERAMQERAMLERAAEEIREAVRSDPSLAELARQLAIDLTPDGLRLQIMDEVKLPMFATGSSVPNERARALIQKIAPILKKLPEPVSIAGHTDATPYAGTGKTNWELSAERANATRRLLTESGLPDNRVQTVTGHADRDPLLPADPYAPANRRIAILVRRQALAP